VIPGAHEDTWVIVSDSGVHATYQSQTSAHWVARRLNAGLPGLPE
jgi:hypothetical protein